MLRPVLLLYLAFALVSPAAPLRFRITLSESASSKPVSGRLLVLMSDEPQKQDRLRVGFVPGATWIAAMEAGEIAPGVTVEFDADRKAYPEPFSQAKPGKYQFMAVLDPNHSFARAAQDAGDLFSDVVQVESLDPSDAEPVSLVLTKVTPAQKLPDPDTDDVQIVEMQSPLLTAFWGRPINVRAVVVLPPKRKDDPARRYPAWYHIHGFGGNHLGALSGAGALAKNMGEGKRYEMVHVFLDASCPTGHHVFADSVNNGPWGRALTEEFVPYLEQKFPLAPRPGARFLNGHSSGGWSTLWLQITYPDFFGGTWSTAPDPVDFRSFTGIDAAPGSTQNAYRTKDGSPLNLVRKGGKDLATFEQFARQEAVMGEYGGQIASFDWVFSPRGQDGRPMKLFDRETGRQDPFVQKAWEKYDIRKIVEGNWPALGPKLLGKLHLTVGSEDTFHLEEAMILFCGFLKSKGREDACEVIPGRDHGDLYRPYKTYPDGLNRRIENEMRAAFEGSSVKP